MRFFLICFVTRMQDWRRSSKFLPRNSWELEQVLFHHNPDKDFAWRRDGGESTRRKSVTASLYQLCRTENFGF